MKCFWLALLGSIAGLTASASQASLTVYNNDKASYDAAAATTLFVDFETDKFGANVDGRVGAIAGDTFSFDVVYSSPDIPTGLVNIADIRGDIGNEIGPRSWNGTLRWDYTNDMYATAFTGVSFESSATISFFRDNVLVGATGVGGSNSTFQHFGFVSSEGFDRVELSGRFYAIDAHQSSVHTGGAVPEPGSITALAGLMTLAAGAFARRRLA